MAATDHKIEFKDDYVAASVTVDAENQLFAEEGDEGEEEFNGPANNSHHVAHLIIFYDDFTPQISR